MKPITEKAERAAKIVALVNQRLTEKELRLLEGGKLQRITKVDRDETHLYVDVSIRLRI